MAKPSLLSTFADVARRSRRMAFTAALFAVPCTTPLLGQTPAPVVPVVVGQGSPTPILITPTQPPPTPAAPATPAPATAPPSAAHVTLVSRIALYPDDLIAIILPASTNPLQLVQADRYLETRKSNPKAPVDEKWDDSVKSLLNYPEIVKTMSKDLDWTSTLGEAVVADLGEVMAAIQTFRRQAQAAGNLKTDPKQVVVIEKEVIKIVPANPQVIYVPTYNPTTVVVYGGYSTWGYYPSPYPVYYYPYPPGAAFATGLIWGAAISATWHGGYACHYGGSANININRNVNIHTGNINVNQPGAANRPNAGGSQWKSGKQPGQVSSTIGKTPPSRVGDSRPGGASRPSTQPSGGSRGGGGNHAGSSSAFSGSGSGHSAQMDSSRGASSRSSMSSSRPSSSGARSGGRGGRR